MIVVVDKSLREEALKKLKLAQEDFDREEAHMVADGVLCDLLVQLGFQNVVEEFHQVKKCYA